MTNDLPDAIVQYFAQRDETRAHAVGATLASLTDRERLLVKDAAVMGWVQGVRHHDIEYPGDRYVVAIVIDACHAFPDLYPTITRHTEGGRP